MFASVAALFAVQAGVCEPLDTDTVANLAIADGVVADGHDNTDTLVSTDKRGLGLERPVTESGMKISVAAA